MGTRAPTVVNIEASDAPVELMQDMRIIQIGKRDKLVVRIKGANGKTDAFIITARFVFMGAFGSWIQFIDRVDRINWTKRKSWMRSRQIAGKGAETGSGGGVEEEKFDESERT